ncbi:hypothetical protein EV356DRAFT_580523 [Viridothelium virens]|uniref:Uncharacterized protein n=1 Tax=Viridothelium virens TaxID=1048519 RepID=A0A6A6GWV2_VIRVR|nr:hypothetical protein EV356DRAFT_580523 [Viridothelium virens]
MADEGASPRELVLEAARRNNTDLLQEIFTEIHKSYSSTAEDRIAELLNTAVDGIGSNVLHVAAINGSYEVLDALLDQAGVETDPLDRLERDTPLHSAVRYVNSLSAADWPHGHPIVEILIDAGCDPRSRNKAKLRPFDLVDPRNSELRGLLQKAEFQMMAGGDVVNEDEEEEEGGAGSASDEG